MSVNWLFSGTTIENGENFVFQCGKYWKNTLASGYESGCYIGGYYFVGTSYFCKNKSNSIFFTKRILL